MNRNVFSKLVQRMTALGILQARGGDWMSLPPAQRRVVLEWYEAARTRSEAANRLFDVAMHGPTVQLYRESVVMLARANLAAESSESAELGLSEAELLARFADALAAKNEGLAARLRSCMGELEGSEGLALDRAPQRELAGRAEALFVLSRELFEFVEPLTQRARDVAVYVQLGSMVLTAALLWFALAQFALQPTNYAKHRATTASSVAYDTTPDGIVDGKEYGAFGFHSAPEPSPWIRIDLGRRYAIDSVKVFGRHDCCYDQSVPLSLEFSDDDQEYSEVAVKQNRFDQVDPWVISAKRRVARYVRLRTLRESVLVLSEVEVFGKPID